MSNFRRIPYPSSDKVAQGLCFSSNERFIYVTNATDIYQIDLENEDEVYHVAYVRSWDETGWPVGLGMIFQGPDCRLYVSPGSTTYYLHVIMKPDRKGAACEFIERGIELPTIIGGDLPNIAQYRYLTGCDSSKEIPFVKTSVINPSNKESDLTLYPNPAHDLLSIKSDKPVKSYTIYSIYGQLLQSDMMNNKEIDILGLSSGTYFLSIEYVDGGRAVEKFVKKR